MSEIAKRTLIVAVGIAIIIVFAKLGNGGALIAGMYIWFPLACGYRYGHRWLYVAQAASVAAFLYIYSSVEWWQNQPREMVFGWLLAIALIPSYVAVLMRFVTSRSASASRFRISVKKEREKRHERMAHRT